MSERKERTKKIYRGAVESGAGFLLPLDCLTVVMRKTKFNKTGEEKKKGGDVLIRRQMRIQERKTMDDVVQTRLSTAALKSHRLFKTPSSSQSHDCTA